MVVLVVFILASPFYRAARDEAARLRCLSARRLIANAQEQYRQHDPKHHRAAALADLKDYLPDPPRCPKGGIFTFHANPIPASETHKAHNEFVILCSHEGHSLYRDTTPDDDTETAAASEKY